MTKEADEGKSVKTDPYDFDEDEDKAEFELPPPKKIRMISPGDITRQPFVKPEETTTSINPYVKGVKKRKLKPVPPTRAARQASPKRPMSVRKPTKTYARPGREGSPIDEGFDDDDDSSSSRAEEEKEASWPKPLPLPSVSVSVPKYSDSIEDIREDAEDEFGSEGESEAGDEPKLGSLVWGRMKGFSYWPCFITKSPGGQFRRGHGISAKRMEYHAQFFNWNNESAWVSKAIPWLSLEEYKRRADAISKSKSPAEWKAWHPAGKGMAKKWEKAYEIAHSTVNLSRKERYCKFLAHYHGRGKKMKDGAAVEMVGPKKEKVQRTAKNEKKRTSVPKSDEQKPRVNQVISRQKQTKAKKQSTAGPACKKAKLHAAASLASPLTSKSILLPGDLPPGWSVINCNHGPFQEFRSPDGMIFNSFIDVVRHLFGQNTAPPIEGSRRRRSYSFSGTSSSSLREGESERGWFLEMSDVARFGCRVELTDDTAGIVDSHIQLYIDDSLPKEWLVKTTRSGGDRDEEEVLFIDPKQRWFSSKVEVAAFIEPKGHPAVEMAYVMGMTLKRNRLQHMAVDLRQQRLEDNPVLREIVSNMSYVELVKLPDVFIEHPCVRVTESANELVIEDAITGDFIAKKIMYDGA